MGYISDTRGYLEDDYLVEGYLAEAVTWTEYSQVNMTINNQPNIQYSQVNMIVNDFQDTRNTQVQMQIADFPNDKNSQVKNTHPFIHRHCLGYLEGPYMEGPYLTGTYCAEGRTQVNMIVNNFEDDRGSQVNMVINDFLDSRNTQVNMVINDFINAQNSEVLQVIIQAFRSQIILSLYNINRPRIMCDFPSRGLTGQNWTATSTEPGDFDVNNVNNDLEEFFWRSASGVKTGIQLICDVESGPIFMDTFAMLNHNLTTSATVTLQGSINSSFAPVGFEENLLVEEDRIFWIAPSLPLNSYQHWRLLISDVTNTADFLSVGVIIFGSSRIFSQECTTDEIIITKKHFKNAFKTEGFTSASNDRSLKKSMRLNFRDLSFDSGDFTLLDEVLDFARTSLKCLWIVDPSTSSLIRRFHAFGKVRKMPDQRHKVRGKAENLDFIDLTVEVDESE